jgi:hypothetical protein
MIRVERQEMMEVQTEYAMQSDDVFCSRLLGKMGGRKDYKRG